MEKIVFSAHAMQQMAERGASKEEVIKTVNKGEKFPAKHNRVAYRRNFQYNSRWGEGFYHTKQVMPITKEEAGRIVIITVYTFYF
jgi:hypothetical protein